MQHLAVIGAGIGGLAAALRLRAQGYNVDVYEAAPRPGGKLSEWRQKGYRFDMGPSLFTLPSLIDELYVPYGKAPTDYYSYKRLQNITRYFYEDGTVLNAYADKTAFGKELAAKTQATAQQLTGYLDEAEQLYKLTAPVFIFSPFSRQALMSENSRKTALGIRKLKAMQSLHKYNARSFPDARVVQLFDRYATYNGSNPYKTPATLRVVSHLEHNTGAYFPDKGMYSIVQGLVKLAEEAGVRFYYNQKVEALRARNSSITHIRTGGKEYSCDGVISDVDIYTLYKDILGQKIPRLLQRQELSSSALIFYWGMDCQSPDLDVHNILFSKDYKAEFKATQAGGFYADPTVYIFISSKIVAGDAPEGKENWFVMLNVPPDKQQDWDAFIRQARQAAEKKIYNMLGIDAQAHRETEHVRGPKDIQRHTGAYKGALYGPSSNSQFSAFLRHKNQSRQYPNLFFTGGSVHPGGGIPLCLASAKIVADQIGK